MEILADSESAQIPPRYRRPLVGNSDFFSSLVQADGRFYFSGILNSWPGLTALELIELRDGKKLLWASPVEKERA